MPSFSSTTEEPDAEEVTVRSITAYATLWSQYLTDERGSTVLYILFGPLFFVQFILTLLTSPQIHLLIKPNLLAVEIPSTAENPPKQPVAYTCEKDYSSRFNAVFLRPLRIITLGLYALKAYLLQQPIAYVICNQENKVSSDAYLVTSDDDSLRPYVLFR